MHLKITNEVIEKEVWIDESTMFECTYFRAGDGRNIVTAIRDYVPGSADNFDNYTQFFGGANVRDLKIELYSTNKDLIMSVRGALNSYVLNDKSQADGTVGGLVERMEFAIGGYLEKGYVVIPRTW